MSRLDDFDWDDFESYTGLRVTGVGTSRGYVTVEAYQPGVGRRSRKAYLDAHFLADGSPLPERLECLSCHVEMDAGCKEPDACIGRLPGVRGACCGHGDPDEAYICMGANDVREPHREVLNGVLALERIEALKRRREAQARIKELEAEIERLRQVT